MTIAQLLNLDVAGIEAISESELEAYLCPYYPRCRPTPTIVTSKPPTTTAAKTTVKKIAAKPTYSQADIKAILASISTPKKT